MKKLLLSCTVLTVLCINGIAQTTGNPMPVLIKKNGRHQLLVDGKPFFILGGQAHNSSAWPGMLPQVWQAAEKMHLNALEIPIYWEQIEPQQGKFDFSLVDTIINQAHEHHTRLVLLWFGTWKNGSSHYMPEWMKAEPLKYPNIMGNTGKPVDSPSPHSEATLEADIKAFSAVMKHLKAFDQQHTVIMVQVENEAGAWGSVRDFGPVAQKLFEMPVPPALLKPEVLNTLKEVTSTKGTWQQVFGNRADEYFHAWYVAGFIGRVAAAGKAAYPLPLYVNAALRDPLTDPTANKYESGGPTDNVLPIWKAAAPAIDILAPDIYQDGSERILKVLDLYDRKDNALLIPETSLRPANAMYLYSVIAHGGIGFSPFGIDVNLNPANNVINNDRLDAFAKEYAMAIPMITQLAEWGFEGKVKAVVEHEDHAEQAIDLGGWQAIVSFSNNRPNAVQEHDRLPGRIMIVKLQANKFVVIGAQCHITFKPTGDNTGKAWQYLKAEEGSFDNGVFKPLRILNGDETDFGGPRFEATPVVTQISLIIR